MAGSSQPLQDLCLFISVASIAPGPRQQSGVNREPRDLPSAAGAAPEGDLIAAAEGYKPSRSVNERGAEGPPALTQTGRGTLRPKGILRLPRGAASPPPAASTLCPLRLTPSRAVTAVARPISAASANTGERRERNKEGSWTVWSPVDPLADIRQPPVVRARTELLISKLFIRTD